MSEDFVKIRGHELDDQYRFFVMKDPYIFEEMLNPLISYGEEFTNAYEGFLKDLKPNTPVIIVDTCGSICDLGPGCPNLDGEYCVLFKKHNIDPAIVDKEVAEEWGVELYKPYRHGELVNILSNAEPSERFKKTLENWKKLRK